MTTATATRTWLTASGWRRMFRDKPLIPLIGLLGILIVLSELARPGIVQAEWAGTVLRAAVPLAILAGCQTLTMLTGGIDLSVDPNVTTIIEGTIMVIVVMLGAFIALRSRAS